MIISRVMVNLDKENKMQIRCVYCQRPYGLTHEVIHAALDQLTAENLGHYNSTCPHCHKMNRVGRQALLRAAPDWKPGLPAAPEGEEEQE